MPTDAVVHVIDDDNAVRDSLSFLLKSAGHAVRTYESAADFLERGAATSGCVVTDVRMPGMSGLDLIRALAERGTPLPIIVMTGHGDVPMAVEAMKLGAADFLEKPFDDDAMLASIRMALARGADAVNHAAQAADIRTRLASLSQRERQVLDGLVAGHANKTIAYNLDISPRTVEVYRANVMTKMEAGSLSELVRMVLMVERPAAN